jgi:hypothetical protein
MLASRNGARIGGPRDPRDGRRAEDCCSGDEFGDDPRAVLVVAIANGVMERRRRSRGFVFAGPEARTSVTLAIDPSLSANVPFLVVCLNRLWARFAHHRNRIVWARTEFNQKSCGHHPGSAETCATVNEYFAATPKGRPCFGTDGFPSMLAGLVGDVRVDDWEVPPHRESPAAGLRELRDAETREFA